MPAANNQFLDTFNNGGGLLSSVTLFQMIFTFKRWLEAEAYFRRRRALLGLRLTELYIICCPKKAVAFGFSGPGGGWSMPDPSRSMCKMTWIKIGRIEIDSIVVARNL